MSGKLPFYADCVHWSRRLLPVLNQLIDNGREISRATFLRRADADASLIPAWDHYIRYYAYRGVYWYDHSAIEHVFARPEQITELLHEAEAAEA